MTMPAPFDLLAALLALLLVLYGLLRGLARMITGAAGLAAGWILAARYEEPLARRLGATIAAPGVQTATPDWTRLAAFALIFAGVTLVFCLIGWMITRALGAAKLGGANRLAGAGLGLLVAMVLMCAATVPMVALWQPEGGSLLRESRLAPYAVAGGQYLAVVAADPLAARYAAAARRYFEPPAVKPLPGGTPGEAPGNLSERKPAPAPRPH